MLPRARLILSCLALIATLLTGHGSARAAEVWPTAGWETASPEAEGMDSAALADLIGLGRTGSLDSLLIARHGRIVLDAYYAPYSADVPHIVNSTTKSIISTLLAMLHKDGKLASYDLPVLPLFAGREIANRDDRKAAMTVKALLDMTSGLDWEEGLAGGSQRSTMEMIGSKDWVQYVLNRPMARAPRESFQYNSGGSHLLSAIVAKLSGQNTADFAQQRLFDPLGIRTPRWRRDPQGLPIGGFGLALLPRDMAKFGYFYLRGGRWDGNEMLPKDWITSTRTDTVDMKLSFAPGLRYANQFWVRPERNVYMTSGLHCQMIIMIPDQDLVVVTTGRANCPPKLLDGIRAAVKSDSALPPSPEGSARLAAVLAEIAEETPAERKASPAMASAIAGKTYRFAGNPLGFRELTLRLTDERPLLEWVVRRRFEPEKTDRVISPVGLDGHFRKGTSTDLGAAAARAEWIDDSTLVVDLRFVGIDDERRWKLNFAGETVTVRSKTRTGEDVSFTGEARD